MPNTTGTQLEVTGSDWKKLEETGSEEIYYSEGRISEGFTFRCLPMAVAVLLAEMHAICFAN